MTETELTSEAIVLSQVDAAMETEYLSVLASIERLTVDKASVMLTCQRTIGFERHKKAVLRLGKLLHMPDKCFRSSCNFSLFDGGELRFHKAIAKELDFRVGELGLSEADQKGLRRITWGVYALKVLEAVRSFMLPSERYACDLHSNKRYPLILAWDIAEAIHKQSVKAKRREFGNEDLKEQ